LRKHQFVKTDCNCLRKATYLTCKFCGTVEYCGLKEARSLVRELAECPSPNAPELPSVEFFKVRMGATVNCLAPDYATWQQDQPGKGPDMPDSPVSPRPS
jgi:hypothetical protein